MLNNVKVSVVIPVYNVSEYLRQCLDTVIGQSLSEIEIICVNDGSTDDSLEILKEYQEKDARIQIVSQENKGLSEARNTGAKSVTGEYLYFLDSDDWLELDALEKLYTVSKENALEILYFSGTVFFEKDEYTEQEAKLDLHRPTAFCDGVVRTGCAQFEEGILGKRVLPFAWLQFFSTSYYQENQLGFYPDIYYEDNLFTFQSVMSAERTLCLSEELYHYRKRDGSITRATSTTKSIESYMAVFMGCLLSLKEKKLPKEREKIYRRFLDEIRDYVAYHYGAVYGQQRVYVEEMLLNLERVFFGETTTSIFTQGDFCENRNLYPQLCFFGSGLHCHVVLDFFTEQNIAFPVAICDNDQQKQGTSVRGIPVISFQEALENYKNIAVLITNQAYFFEILQQVEEVVSADHILRLDI